MRVNPRPLYVTKLKKFLGFFYNPLILYWKKNWLTKLLCSITITVGVLLAGMYGIARWYIATEASKPLVMGTSFIPSYASSLGLDPKQTLDAMLGELHVKHLRLVSYWSQTEPSPGEYDFSTLDWEFQKAEAAHAKITLSVGLRQPRWPECHVPAWAKDEPQSGWQPQLATFMTVLVNRYKTSPALDSYQVENEYFLHGFGICNNFDRSRLVSEYNLIKSLDPNHKAIVARSNNAVGWPVGAPTPDEYGISIYKRAWENRFLHRYIEYPFPAWFYAFTAGFEKIMTGRDLMVHELQTEAWPPNYQTIPEASLAEQNRSFSADRFKSRVAFGKATGMREIYLWGGEYWYYRKVLLHDPSLWNVAQQTFSGN